MNVDAFVSADTKGSECSVIFAGTLTMVVRNGNLRNE
jgi:hypothetical protein